METDEDQRIDVSMLDSALAMMACWVLNASLTGDPPTRTGNGRTFVGAYGCYDASDARLMIGAATGRQNARMWRALGRDDLAREVEGLRIRDLRDRRARDAATLAEIIRTRTADEWEANDRGAFDAGVVKRRSPAIARLDAGDGSADLSAATG